MLCEKWHFSAVEFSFSYQCLRVIKIFYAKFPLIYISPLLYWFAGFGFLFISTGKTLCDVGCQSPLSPPIVCLSFHFAYSFAFVQWDYQTCCLWFLCFESQLEKRLFTFQGYKVILIFSVGTNMFLFFYINFFKHVWSLSLCRV